MNTVFCRSNGRRSPVDVSFTPSSRVGRSTWIPPSTSYATNDGHSARCPRRGDRRHSGTSFGREAPIRLYRGVPGPTWGNVDLALNAASGSVAFRPNNHTLAVGTPPGQRRCFSPLGPPFPRRAVLTVFALGNPNWGGLCRGSPLRTTPSSHQVPRLRFFAHGKLVKGS